METPQKQIEIRTYKVYASDDYIIKAYLSKGDWCKPCTRIKPHLALLETTKILFLQDIIIVDKETKPKPLIPAFDICYNNGDIIRSVQTSKPEELNEFIDKTFNMNRNY